MEKCVCGLFMKDSNKSVPLTGVHYDVDVKSFAGQITINQTYKNEELTDIECIYGFPINDNASVIGFTVKIDGRVINSQFKKKDEAFKEYNDAISRGDGAYLLDQADRSDDTFVMSVGRLPPQKECTVSISYVCTLDSVTETKLRLVVPTSLSPRYSPEGPKDTKGTVAPPEKYQSSVPYLATLKANIHMFDAITSVTSPSHPLSVNIQGSNNVLVCFGAQQQPLDRDLVIEIEVKSNPQQHVEVEQIGPNEYAAMYSFIPHFEANKHDDTKSELIFLLDCSGSMDQENKIGDAKRAMQIFLRSIPEGCYFNLVRFGSQFESLFAESEAYGADSFSKGKSYADQVSANMGGTEILAPLENIFSKLPRAGFARQLFLLTDGEVTNTEQVIALVKRNASNTRVFSFGLGQSPSRSLVNGIALAGNGKSEFIKQGESLEDKIGRHLTRALQPAVTNASILWEGVGNVLQVPSVLPPVYRGDRQLVFAFFDKNPKSSESSVILQINGVSLEKPFSLPEEKDAYNHTISKLAARSIIKELETKADGPLAAPVRTGSLQNREVKPDACVAEASLDAVKAKITDISLQHGVLSKYVSLVAVETRETVAGPLDIREIPIQKLEQHDQFQGHNLMHFSSSIPMARRHKRSLGKCAKMLVCRAQPPPPVDIYCVRGIPSDEVDNDVEEMLERCADNVEETEADGVATTTHFLPLNTLLDLQLWDGSWQRSAQLDGAGVTGNMLDEATKVVEHLKLEQDVIATLFVTEFIKEKYPEHLNIWHAIVNKAMTFVYKKAPSLDLQDISARFKKFF